MSKKPETKIVTRVLEQVTRTVTVTIPRVDMYSALIAHAKQAAADKGVDVTGCQATCSVVGDRFGEVDDCEVNFSMMNAKESSL